MKVGEVHKRTIAANDCNESNCNAFRFPEDIFLTRLYSSGVLRYAENDSDLDYSLRLKYTAKGE